MSSNDGEQCFFKPKVKKQNVRLMTLLINIMLIISVFQLMYAFQNLLSLERREHEQEHIGVTYGMCFSPHQHIYLCRAPNFQNVNYCLTANKVPIIMSAYI